MQRDEPIYELLRMLICRGNRPRRRIVAVARLLCRHELTRRGRCCDCGLLVGKRRAA